jgi:hypothetical protein
MLQEYQKHDFNSAENTHHIIIIIIIVFAAIFIVIYISRNKNIQNDLYKDLDKKCDDVYEKRNELMSNIEDCVISYIEILKLLLQYEEKERKYKENEVIRGTELEREVSSGRQNTYSILSDTSYMKKELNMLHIISNIMEKNENFKPFFRLMDTIHSDLDTCPHIYRYNHCSEENIILRFQTILDCCISMKDIYTLFPRSIFKKIIFFIELYMKIVDIDDDVRVKKYTTEQKKRHEEIKKGIEKQIQNMIRLCKTNMPNHQHMKQHIVYTSGSQHIKDLNNVMSRVKQYLDDKNISWYQNQKFTTEISDLKAKLQSEYTESNSCIQSIYYILDLALLFALKYELIKYHTFFLVSQLKKILGKINDIQLCLQYLPKSSLCELPSIIDTVIKFIKENVKDDWRNDKEIWSEYEQILLHFNESLQNLRKSLS